jgi:Flp pilus assembly protein TadG
MERRLSQLRILGFLIANAGEKIVSVRTASKKSQSGQAIVMFTLMISSVLIPMVGLAIDGGRGYLVRLKLSSAVDGGALAAARLLGAGANASLQLTYAQETAKQFVAANFPSKFFGSDLVGTANVCVDPGSDSTDPCHVGNGVSVSTYKMRTVVVSATAQMPTFFMRLLGMPTVTVSSNGIASRRDVRVVLVVDRSSSMSGFFGTSANSIVPMTKKFVSSFSGAGDLGGRDELGLVVFGGSGIVAYPPRDVTKDFTDPTQFTPPNNNFKQSGNMLDYLDALHHGSNTGTAEALYLAYMTLRADAQTNPDLSTKLNVIVLFTDGLPNGITAYANDPAETTNYMMKSTSGCAKLGQGNASASPLVSAANNNMIGWFSQQNGFAGGTDTSGAYGLRKHMMVYPYAGFTGRGNDIDAWMRLATSGTGTSDTELVAQMTPSATCNSPMVTTMARFPNHDLYGNYTDLSAAPAVGGVVPPHGPTGQPLYKLGDLYSNQCGGATYNPTKTSNACQIGLASWQATAHQAWKIWNQIMWDKTSNMNKFDTAVNQSSPVIFTIGFDHSASGGEAPDMSLLQLIANDPASPAPFSARVKGQAFRAADPNAVDAAFQQIASQILRLAQ